MSRIGKKALKIPQGIKVVVDGTKVTVDGPHGRLERMLHPLIRTTIEDGCVHVRRTSEHRLARGLHGLSRTLIENMIQGVAKPFEKTLEIGGVGYRAELAGSELKLQLGLAHEVRHAIPREVKCTVDKQVTIRLSSSNKELLGQVAAAIRKYRPADPYKLKGVKYAGERIKQKEGKTGAG